MVIKTRAHGRQASVRISAFGWSENDTWCSPLFPCPLSLLTAVIPPSHLEHVPRTFKFAPPLRLDMVVSISSSFISLFSWFLHSSYVENGQLCIQSFSVSSVFLSKFFFDDSFFKDKNATRDDDSRWFSKRRSKYIEYRWR